MIDKRNPSAISVFLIKVPGSENLIGITSLVLTAESTHPRAFAADIRETYLEKVVEIIQEWQQGLQDRFFNHTFGVHNRERFDQDLETLLKRAQVEQHTLGLIILDINNLKTVNDNYGHSVGDKMIRAVAHGIDAALKRVDDRIYTYGGDEFTLLMPGASEEWLSEFVGTAEEPGRLRFSIQEKIAQFKNEYGVQNLPSQPVALGFGEFSSYSQGGEKDLNGFFDWVDKRMYEDKDRYKDL